MTCHLSANNEVTAIFCKLSSCAVTLNACWCYGVYNEYVQVYVYILSITMQDLSSE
jgi:hypothetical protein